MNCRHLQATQGSHLTGRDGVGEIYKAAPEAGQAVWLWTQGREELPVAEIQVACVLGLETAREEAEG